MRDVLVPIALAVVVIAALIGTSLVVHQDTPPTSWDACGLTWTQALSDPEARVACHR